MIGLSTSLLCGHSGIEILDMALGMGFTQIELNFTLSPKQVSDITRSFCKLGITISSLHNFVPEPSEGERGLMLSDLDETLRKKAVELTKDTILRASDIGATAVVLHLGQPREQDLNPIQYRLRDAIRDKKDPIEIDAIKSELSKARKVLTHLYLNSILNSLDQIVIFADDRNINLGVENRYFFGQFPDFEELGIVLQEFSGSSLGYWHDCGHAAHTAYCQLGSESEYLDAFGNRLIGVHLHDIKGWNDHQIPGSDGDIDFKYLLPYLNIGAANSFNNPLLVLELSKERDLELVNKGIYYLLSLGIQ